MLFICYFYLPAVVFLDRSVNTIFENSTHLPIQNNAKETQNNHILS
jgi:hypothetical protein